MVPLEPTQSRRRKASSRAPSRRGAARFPAGLPAELRLADGTFPCDVADLSRSGARLTGRFPPPPPRARVGVVLASPAGDLRIPLHARVARVERAEDATEVGLEFRDVARGERARLERLLSRVIEGSGTGVLGTLDPTAKPDEIRAALGKMPAAHRIGLAARAQAPERRLLRQDPNPLVLEALARNPGGTVEEAVALARLPMLRPTTVTILAEDPRFRKHEELQILLASHPQAPLSTAEKVVARLGARGRARLLERPGLHPILRRKLVQGRSSRI